MPAQVMGFSFSLLLTEPGSSDVDMLTYDPVLSRVRINMGRLVEELIDDGTFEENIDGWAGTRGTVTRSTGPVFITNGTFDAGISGWTAYATGTLSHDTATPITGAGSLQVAWPGSTSSAGAYVDLPVTIPGGTTTRLTFKTRFNGARPTQLNVAWHDGTSSWNITSLTPTAGVQSWDLTQVVPAGKTLKRLFIYAHNGMTGPDTFDVDDVELTGWAAHDGDAALRYDADTGQTGERHAGYTAKAPVTAGTEYTAVGWARNGTGFETVTAGLAWYDETGTFLSEDNGSEVTLGTSWTRAAVTATAPENAADAEPRFTFGPDPGSAAAFVFLDSVSAHAGGDTTVTGTAVVERSTDLRHWATVRGGLEQTITAHAGTLDDYEFGSGKQNFYRVRVFNGDDLVWTYRDDITVAVEDVWLKSIRLPFLNRPIVAATLTPVTRSARSGTFDVIGRAERVAVTGRRGSREFDLVAQTLTADEREAMDAALATGDVLFIQPPAGSPLPGGYYAVGDTTEDRRDMPWDRRWWTLPLTQVAPPGPDVVGATMTWRAGENLYSSWAAAKAENTTWRDLKERIAQPSDVVVT